MNKIDYSTEEKFIDKVTKKLRLMVTGEDKKMTFDERPSRTFFVGTLCNQDPNFESSQRNIMTMIKPFSMGAEFLISKKDSNKAHLKIKPSGAFYYRVNPNYDKQIQHMKERFKQTYPDEDFEKFMKLSLEGKNEKKFGAPMLKAYKKVKLPEDFFINIKIADALKNKEGDFKKELDSEITKLIETADSDPEMFHTMKHPGKIKYAEKEEKELITFADMESEDSFKERLNDWNNNPATPIWDVKIAYKVTDFDEENIKVKILFTNECKQQSGDNTENYVFEARLDFEIDNGEFQDFVVDYLKDNYKYDGNINASGINCSAILKSKTRITTEPLPVHKQIKKITNIEIQTKFEDLAKNPVEELSKILRSMKESLADMKKDMTGFIESGTQEIKEIKEIKYKEDLKLFENEVKRFENGIKIIKQYDKVKESFQLMNQSFMKSAKGYTSWRLFQIIFIVMNIPDIAKREYSDIDADPEIVDVIYFSTGGGKSEAYLGLVVLTAFFDRLRGKFAGVTAITKFPLRLLSLQQLQRIADIFAKAEIIRREHPEIGKGKNEPFSMGYYVGKKNTPNVLIKKDDWGTNDDYLTPLLNNEEERDKMLIISKCPFCEEETVKIKPDVENVRLLHECQNPNCKEILPIYISDIEVYRYLPTFIISTLDKIPICGYQSNFRNIFGQVKWKCPKHGYTSSDICTEVKGGCKVSPEDFESVELYDPTPTLQIQDEMHLIKESFGSFDAHYETYLIEYQKRINNNKPIKIIAATATINDDFYKQIKHLYGRNKSIRFPSSGPDRKKSFYALEDPEGRISRTIIGLLPHNKTIRFSVIDLIKYYSQIIRNYWMHPEELVDDPDLGINSKEEAQLLLQNYTTILEYNLTKRDGAAINQSVHTMINPYLIKIGKVTPNKDELKFVSMTGDVRFKDVRAVLNKLENFEGKPEIDLITATSMISHGVDIDSLNYMIFHGMPTNTAEYVQAYSRVGRSHPGLIFIVLNPTRERDQSYYKYFEKFHEFQDLLVESVPINRWAKFSINRTLPGIFTSSLMHYFDIKAGGKRLDLTKGFQEAYQEGYLNENELKEFLIKCYKTKDDELGNNFKRVIEKRVSQYLDQILQSKKQQFIPTMLSDKPMTSLRDIDEQVEIKITADSAPAMVKIAGVSETDGGDSQ